MGRAAQVYDVTLIAGGTDVVLAEGSYYRILTATGALSVRRDDGSRVGPLLEGQGERNSPFKRLTLQDMSGAANSVTILVCDGDFVDHRQAGEVLTINGSARRTLDGVAFLGFAFVGPVAANYSHVQLWNPHASLHAAVTKIWPTSYSANPVFDLRTSNAALTTSAGAPASKFVGGSASSMQLRTDALASLTGVTRVFNAWATSLAPMSCIDLSEAPIIIPPGLGLTVMNDTINSQLAVTFEFYEFTP